MLALLVPTLLLELALQLGYAIVSWVAHDRDGDLRVGEPCAVLCVGDSFTFGLGATDPDHSYPAALERALVARPCRGRSQVVNAAWPGSSSREVLLELERRLQTMGPAAVAVLARANDLWRRPEPVDGEAMAADAEGAAALHALDR
ncbi:MAG: SGNH/GDSL hydrolase family protein [Planctomycetes bacterium]|nr:SGNH/GDSL hydrolase family protein [Planctomycetota bacterium]